MYVQCRRDPPPWWISAIGTMKVSRLVQQLGGSAGQNMKRQQNTTALKGPVPHKYKGMGEQGGGGPHAAAPLVKEMSEGGGNRFPKTPREMPSASKVLQIFGVCGGENS